ncbi:breast carcinoma-amplified sequence 1 isoform X22 [Notamacropus eugenii]|uniref:breast carcinoma-amplified sequence 1 isoform X22 n=1 Tax=Notamacropus eugenii TaxID=9315 RepID=UPI003B675670
MGNQLSVPQKNEEQMNESSTDSSQVAPELGCIQNGLPATKSVLIVQEKNDASTETSVNQGDVATSFRTTMEISTVSEANGKNLGKEAKAPTPAAKSRFFLTFSRPVPGRTVDQGTDSSVGSVSLDVSSENPPANKASSENMKLPATAALEEDSDKTQNQVPAEASLSTTEQPTSPPPEAEGAAPAKPKEPSFFDKFFKLDKKKENIPVPTGIQEGTENTENQHLDRETPGLSSQSNNVPEEKDIVDSKEQSEQENPVGVSSSVPEDVKKPEIVQETVNITENNNPVMSFFKTLVSSNKAETKTDSEDKGSKAEKVHDGPSGQKTTGEVQAKGAKKKNPESPSLGYAFRKFFRHKSSKETQSTSNTKSIKEDTVPKGAEENTSDSTEKAITPPEPEPTGPGQKNKEASKEKKPTADQNKQKGNKKDVTEQVNSPDGRGAEKNSMQNGGDSKESPLKRPEKRQSLGSFFKGLGPKRMSDAEVQTDPVSIGPVGKSK